MIINKKPPQDHLREALDAVDELEKKVYEKLCNYEEQCERYGDGPNLVRSQMTRTWLEKEGKDILVALKRKIQVADPETRQGILAAIQAAIDSGDATAQRDMSEPLNRDMLWEWADQIVSSMEVAFRRFPDTPLKN